MSRQIILSTLAIIMVATASACSGGDGSTLREESVPGVEPQASSNITLYTGGIIYTAVAGQFAEAMAVEDGEIIAVGSNSKIEALDEPGAVEVDLQGRMVIPGLHDSHVHILEANSPLSGTCIVGRGRSPTELIEKLKRCAPRQEILTWVLGFGWDITSFIQSGENPLQAIDRAIPDRPAAIMEETSHAVWVNSRALEALGITQVSPDPAGGHIVRDADGFPNGLLIDNAGDLAFEAALARTPEIDEQHYQGLLDGLALLARNGITAIADARVYWSRGYHEFYDRAESEGKLTARATLSMWAYPQMDDATQLPQLASFYSRQPSQLVQKSQIKVYADGITVNTTARTLRPYLIDYGFGTPFGLNYFSEDRLASYIIELEKTGYDFHIHTIGAGGVRDALNAIERAMLANPTITNRRHRLTHLENVHPDDIPRFASMGVIADIQLAGDFTEPKQFAIDNEPFTGADNPALPLPARALINAGATVTLSSDYDVSPLSPFIGIANATSRGKNSLTVREAVDAYTINAAYLMRQENLVGSLEIGKRADFVIIDRNIFEIPNSEIRNTNVLLTVFDGDEVYRDKAF